jgi:hypothetical protein
MHRDNLPPIRIHQQNRRSLVMKRTPVGLVVFIPRWLKPDSPQVRTFVEEGLRKLGTPVPQPQTVSEDDLRLMVGEWSRRIGVKPGRVQIRDMYRKWGSCSSRGNITLNTALCRLPRPLAEYIVCHELIHLLIFNHSKQFKALMSQHMPDWREREQTLQQHLNSGKC